tara:strand:+ start:132 stop:515 length:384 start_codon:yes stop_codon:yes gene_type:complete
MLKDLDGPHEACRECAGDVSREYPVTAAMGFMPFEAYYDEALDMDIHGRREKKQVLNAMGLQETGDPVGGARNWEKNAPSVMKPQATRGRTYDDSVKEKEVADSFTEDKVTVQNSQGDWAPANMKDI